MCVCVTFSSCSMQLAWTTILQAAHFLLEADFLKETHKEEATVGHTYTHTRKKTQNHTHSDTQLCITPFHILLSSVYSETPVFRGNTLKSQMHFFCSRLV